MNVWNLVLVEAKLYFSPREIISLLLSDSSIVLKSPSSSSLLTNHSSECYLMRALAASL